MFELQNIVKSLENNNSISKKQSILTSYFEKNKNDEFLKKFLELVYSPYFNYYVTVDVAIAKGKPEKSNYSFNYYEDIYNLAEKLNSRELSGQEALDTVKKVLISDETLGFILKCILNRTISKGVNVKLINNSWKEVYLTELINEFSVALGVQFEKLNAKQIVSINEEEYFISRKVDGCFKGDTKILLEDGTYKTIKEIVDNKLPLKVLSYNEKTKQIEAKRITNWFNNGLKSKEEWISIRQGNSFATTITATKNHKFFDGKQFSKIEDFDLNNIHKISYDYNDIQKQVCLGLVFGDGSIAKDKRFNNDYRISFSHSEKQKNYYFLLKEALNIKHFKDTLHISGYGSKILAIKSHNMPFIKEIYNMSFEERLSKITPLSLAIWYMDDGYLGKNKDDNKKIPNLTRRIYLATNSLGKEKNEILKKWFKETYNIDCSIVKDRRKKEEYSYTLAFSSEGSEKFKEIIAPYIPACMNYKIDTQYHNIEKYDWYKNNEFEKKLIKVSYEKALKVSLNKKEEYSYDLEVEDNHNYFANNVLVHNCRLLTIKNKFYSRAGNEVLTLMNLKNDLFPKNINLNVALDGEICYVNDTTGIENFKLITTLIRRKDYQLPLHIDNHTLVYHLFDVIPLESFEKHIGNDLKFKERYDYLKKWIEKFFTNNKHIKLLEQEKLNDFFKKQNITGKDNYECLKQVNIPDGWEGFMLRKNTYYQGKRSGDLIKVKLENDTELECIDVEMTTKQMLNDKGIMKDNICIGALICKYKGNLLKVGSGLSDTDRLLDKSTYIGHLIKVKYTSESKDKNGVESLRHPRFISIRDIIE